MRHSFTLKTEHNSLKEHRNKRDSQSSSTIKKKALNKAPSLSNYLDVNARTFFIQKNKNILHDYEQFLKVKEERKNGIFFSSIKKLSYEERKKNETYNFYNKSPFKNDPRLIITNYKVLKEKTTGEQNKIKNKILGVDEGLIQLPKIKKDINMIDLFHGYNATDKNAFDSPNKTKDTTSPDKLSIINTNMNKHKYILASLRKKKKINPMFLDRGQETFSNLDKKKPENKNSNKSYSKERTSIDMLSNKFFEKLGKQREKYENELNYNYEIKCLDNWDFEHITKHKDIKTDNEFKHFLDEVDNSQMKWLVEIKNDKEQLQLMRRNKHLYDFLTQIDKEQQAMIMQSMNLNKKGFDFDIFNKNNNDNSKDKNDENICKTEVNNDIEGIEIDNILDNKELSSNGSISRVEFYRQVMKEKIKVEEMFHIELRAVAEECYLTNVNKKKSVILLFENSQQLNALFKKKEKIKELYHKKIMNLQLKKKKKDKKKKMNENNISNNFIDSINKNYLNKYKDLKLALYKKESGEIKKTNTNKDNSSSNSSSTSKKKNNFQQQSEFLAKKNAIENEFKLKMAELEKEKIHLNTEYEKINKEIKFNHNMHKKAKSKLEQRIKILSSYYYQILKKGIDVRHTGLTWVIVKLLELGAFIDKHHFPTFLNDEQICYLMKTGAKTYELSEFVKLFQILKKKQKTLREKHINENIEKEKIEKLKKFNKIKELNKNKKYQIGNDYMEYIEEIQRKYEKVINICLNENKEESNIIKISNDLKQYILQDSENDNTNTNTNIDHDNEIMYEEEMRKLKKNKKLELLFIPGSLSEYFAKDKRFRQYFDDVFYLNEEINKRQEQLAKEKHNYLNFYRNKMMRGALFGNSEINSKYRKKKTTENEIVYAALFGNGISI